MSKGNVSFCCFPSGLLPPPPSTAFLNTKTILSFHMQKSMLVHRLHRDVQSICVAGSPKVWLSSVLYVSSSLSSPVLFLDVSLETGRLGAKRIHVNWKPHGCETGQHTTPSVCNWTNKTPFSQIFPRRRKQAQNRAVAWPGLLNLGILPLSPVIFQGSLLVHPAGTLIQWADSHYALRGSFQ